MPKLIHKLLCILVLMLPMSANGEYFRHLTLGDGLSQTSVMAITQDKLGRMWLGTKEGVNVYDGVSITPYKGWIKYGNEEKPIWIGNEVKSIVTDSIGNIFIMIDRNIIKFDLKSDRFSRFTINSRIRGLAQHDGEVIYIAHDSIMIKNRKNDNTRLAFTIPSVKDITHLGADKRHYYIATVKGLHVFDRQNRSHKVLLSDEEIYSSFISKDGTLWITAVDKGLYRLGKGDKQPVAVSSPIAPEEVLGARQCRNAIEDKSGKIWYGSFSGLFCYNPSDGETRHIKIPINIGGLTHSSVYGMYCDRKGNLWVGTYYGGVNYFSPDHDKFLNFNYDSFVPDNLSHSFVKDMVMDKNGNLWFATDGAGVGCLDKNWTIIEHLSTSGTGKPLRQNNVRCLEYDPGSDRLFIGTHLGGLSVYDIKQKTVKNLIDIPQYQEIPGNIIHQLKVHKDYLFISSRSGISYLDLNTGIIKELKTNITPKMFDIDKNGDIYCTTAHDHGLYKICRPTSEHPVTVPISPSDKKIFPSQICATDKGVLVSTLGNGLLYYPYDNSPMEHINTSNSQLPNDYCYAISRSADGVVFVTTEDNVVRLDMADRSIQSVNFSDLFPESHIINGCALLSLANGDILIGSTKGITRLNPHDFNTSAISENAPNIYFSKLHMQNNDILPDDGHGILEKALPYSDCIHLPSENNAFSITIGRSDYIATTGAPTIEYRLEGIDDEWLTVSGNEISYKNLPSGSYRLFARQPGGKEISIDIIVATPWYRSWWAWLVYIALSLGLGYFIIHKTLTAARLRMMLKKEKTEREQIEKVNHNLLSLRNILRKQFEKRVPDEDEVPQVNPLDEDLLKRATDIIDKNINNLEFDIPQLCREVGMSRSLFFNKFKSLTGLTPNAFILDYRLKYAATLLTTQPHLTISEVADKSGFTTAIYFSRCFKKQFGVSPLNYRKGSSEEEAPEVLT